MNKNFPVLIDFDGIIRIGNKPADDAGEFLKFISDQKIPSYIISNSTLKSTAEIKQYLRENDIDYGINAMTTVDASINYIKNNYKKVSVFCSNDIKAKFNEFIDNENPEAVIVGDLGERWNYENMNKIFRLVFEGADLIAMQRNKYWKPDGINLSLDAGAFITAIEYAASIEAVLIGKPSPLYFHSAIKMLGFPENQEFIMIGDDLETDIYASQKIGGTGILVYTGKTKYPLNEGVKKPDFEARSLKEVISILERFN